MTHLTLPVRRLAWGTDWHMNFLRPAGCAKFLEQLAATDADAFAITGDVSDGNNLEQDLRRLGSAISRPLFVLLGNHDRYHASFAAAEDMVQRATALHPNLHRLTGEQLIELSPNTALIGVDGWADGTAGAGSASAVELNDSRLIHDLAVLSRPVRWQKMHELARQYARAVKPALCAAMTRYRRLILLTHVPPLPEATWHEGEVSDAEYLPHFCNPTLGRLLRQGCAANPETNITVLCGHTHGEGVYQEGRMTIITGGATYGEPQVNRLIEIE